MNLKVSSLVGAFAVVATTVLPNVSPAEAVQLSPDSTLNLSGNVDITGIGPVSGSFNFLDFEFNDEPGLVAVTGRTGDLVSVIPGPLPETGEIQDVPAGLTPGTTIEDFITIPDGFSFDLASISQPPVLQAVATGTTASLSLTGNFDAPGFDETGARAVFSADIPNLTPAQVLAILSGGGTITDVSYSARFVVEEVPEPSATLSLIALGVVGGMFSLRNRKQFTA